MQFRSHFERPCGRVPETWDDPLVPEWLTSINPRRSPPELEERTSDSADLPEANLGALPGDPECVTLASRPTRSPGSPWCRSTGRRRADFRGDLRSSVHREPSVNIGIPPVGGPPCPSARM